MSFRRHRLLAPLVILGGVVVLGGAEGSEAGPVLGSAFGINEAVSVPRAWITTGRLRDQEHAGHLSADASATRGLGASIVRANSPTYPFLDHHSFRERGESWAWSDTWVRAVQAADIDSLMVIGPWPGNRTAAYTDHYLPADPAAYQAWVRAVVERYDGDGIDDMPGLEHPVRHWEVDNEPDLHNSVPPRGAPTRVPPEDFQTAAEYAQVLVWTSAAIKQADPTATVLSAGMYRPHTAPGRRYLAEVLDWPGAREAVDVLSLHCYFDGDELGPIERTLETARTLPPELPVWITETGVPSAGDDAHIDPAWQARMVVAIYGEFLAGGAERVFWHTLADPPARVQRTHKTPFSTHSLLQTAAPPAGRPTTLSARSDKPSGATYRRLAALLAEVPRDSVRPVRTRSGRGLDLPGGRLVYWGSLPPPAGATEVTELTHGLTTLATGPVAAPAFISTQPNGGS